MHRIPRHHRQGLAISFAFFILAGAAGATYVGHHHPATAAAQRITASSGGRLIRPPTMHQISLWSGGAATQRLAVAGLAVQAPQSYRLAGAAQVPFELTSARPGKALLAITCAAKPYARATITFGAGGRTGFRLFLGMATPAIRCSLVVSFTPKRARKSATVSRPIVMRAGNPPSTPITTTTTITTTATTPPATTTTTSSRTTTTTTVHIGGCLRPLVTDPPGGSGDTQISALLTGDWPSNPVVHANVQFWGDTTEYVFDSAGQVIAHVNNGYGDLVATAKVWVTGDNTGPIVCNLWVRQP